VLCFRQPTRSAQVASGCLLGVSQWPTVQCACVSRVIFFAAARPAQQSRWANRLRQALPLLSPSFCSTTFRSYHLGKNENNMMAKKGCGTGTRTFTAPEWARFSACILASLPVIFNVASQILRRWLLQRSNHLVSSACTAACICTYSVSFYSALPFPSLMTDCPDSVPAFLTPV
jgi:hypothetical protein